MRYLILLSLLVIACKKEKPIYSGEITANENGSPWDAKISVRTTGGSNQVVGIAIDHFNASGVKKASLVIFKVKLELGRHKIYPGLPTDFGTKTGAFYLSGPDNSDVLCDNYQVSAADTQINHITLTEINTIARIVKARFDVRLIYNGYSKCNPIAKDTVYFTDGSFSATY